MKPTAFAVSQDVEQFADQSEFSLSAVPVRTATILIYQEIGPTFKGAKQSRRHMVPASGEPTLVEVKYEAVARGTPNLVSPEYMATVRRRQARSLVAAIQRLKEHADRPDFAACTFPITKKLEELILALIDARTEGNSREVLRMVRDTIMDGGWNRYREQQVREAVAQALNMLASAEEVKPLDVEAVFDRFIDLDLKLTPFPLGDE